MGGIVAAGHPVSAEAGAAVLRAGGNAVDAAVAACLASWVAEPLLTGPGAGGYLLVGGAGVEPGLLDFFVSAPSDGARASLVPIDVSFGDANQVFHVGAASCGAPGVTSGLEEAVRRWGSLPLADLAAPAAALARSGVALTPVQAYLFEILEGIVLTTPEAAALFAPGGRALREGERFASVELADTIERFGREGAAPFVSGDLAAAMVDWVGRHGGTLSGEDVAGYAVAAREPIRVAYRGRTVLTNPPPSAGGSLLALALARLDELGESGPGELLDAMAVAQAARTPEFVSRLGSTTHVSVVDGDGRACAVTCTNGEGSGLVVPGTGIHINNIMGEEDLSPLGWFRAAPGQRMPSMMAPTLMLDAEGAVQLALGSAGSNRIRSAILQLIVNVADHGMDARSAVEAPRLHLENDTVYTEPGIDLSGISLSGLTHAPFRAPNLFFGGAQAVERDPATGTLTGAGDPRRGGAAVSA
ncbi:Acylase ACY 1 proenzyme [Baekduia alba]|uniref:gamma-glutamyltransferase n=1 Tax=Baekduia alba TaxID=2997333 RepID=UPI00233FFAAD|nr:gamma-glutamyltransferase [Baekduia alba]WCB92682.1 Acylase ACY 1 proenzyme [Baekduia alba]